MTAITTPARRLVEAFGDCAALEAMYTEDVSWRRNHSLAPNISGPHAGHSVSCQKAGTHGQINEYSANPFLHKEYSYVGNKMGH